jgi:tetratricopeptide (TPR) repeat protein
MMRVINLVALCLAAYGGDLEDGLTAFHKGRYREAQRSLEAAIKTNPRDATAAAFLALTRAALGACTEAIPSLTKVAGDSETHRLAGLALAQCQLNLQQPDAAAATLAQLRRDYPKDADVLYLCARLEIRAYNESVQALFNSAPASYRVNQLSGEIFEIEGKYAEAVQEYRKAIEKNPQAINLHYRLGRALLMTGSGADAYGEAKSEFEKELALNPEDCVAEYQIGQILAAEGKSAEALQRFERALTIKPDFAEAVLAAGKNRLQNRNYPEAIALLKRAVVLQPKSETAHYNLMLAYRNSGDAASAQQEKENLDKIQRPPEGEFSEFLKRLGEKPPQP